MAKATVFSCRREISFPAAFNAVDAENRLRQFVARIGGQLASGGIIPGHIKVLAKVPGKENDFLFLSMTRLGEVDLKRSSQGGLDSIGLISGIELTINVLIIKRSKTEIEEAIFFALNRLCFE